MRVSLAAVGAVVLGAVTVPIGLPAAAAAQCAVPAGVYREPVGWAQRLIGAPRIWPVADGSGQLVAVLGTGVDSDNAQFAPGQVLAGGTGDCDGRGTFAAGIIGAQADPATTFAGIAPGTRILPVRYTQTTTGGDAVGPDALAGALRRAVDAEATVALVAVAVPASSPALAAAVREALARDVVVVAPAVGDKPGSLSYPAALPGVVGVGAVDRDGGLGHRWGVDEPAFAAAHVAGVVALLRSHRPDLTGEQVVTRLTLTANRPASGGHDPRLGWGVLDAYAAVTAELPAGVAGPGAPPVSRPAEAVRVAPGRVRTGPGDRVPGVLGVAGVILAGLVAAGAVTLKRGRARGWRPGRLARDRRR
jgi:membrane-anchored mycosin MYCP